MTGNPKDTANHESPETAGSDDNPQHNAGQYHGERIDPEKLRRLRKALRLSQTEAAELVGIHRTYFVLIETGKKRPSPRLTRAIVEFLAKAELQLQSPINLLDRLRPSSSPRVAEPMTRRAPVVSWGSAGHAHSYEDVANQIDEKIVTDCKDPNAFAIIIEGDSMETAFHAGDRVVFAPNSEPRNGDVVIARLNDGRVFFKYFYRTGPEGARVKFVSANANYSPMEFDSSELAFVYPAWEVRRLLRR